MPEPPIFSGSRFLFWTLAPCLVLFAPTLLFLNRDWLSFALAAMAVLLALKLYDKDRFHWAGRVVAGVVFLAYAAYVLDELRSLPRPFHWPRTEPVIVDAVLGLLVFGVPGLSYAIFARRHAPSSAPSS